MLKRGSDSVWFGFNKGSASHSCPQINPWWRAGRCTFRLLTFNEMLHPTISLVKQELPYGRKVTSEHKVLLRDAVFCLSQIKKAPQVWIPMVTSRWNLWLSHITLIIPSGKGFCANGPIVPEGTRERSDCYTPYSHHPSCCLQLSGHAHDGFLLALHQQEGQQCHKDSLGISPTPLQGLNQGVLHHLVLLHRSSMVFLCLLPAEPNPASQPGCNLTSSLAAPLDEVCVFWMGNGNGGKTICEERTRLRGDE